MASSNINEILLCQMNTTHAESKLVRPHTLSMHAYSIIYDSNQLASTLGYSLSFAMSHLILSSLFPATQPIYDNDISSLEMSLAFTNQESFISSKHPQNNLDYRLFSILICLSLGVSPMEGDKCRLITNKDILSQN